MSFKPSPRNPHHQKVYEIQYKKYFIGIAINPCFLYQVLGEATNPASTISGTRSTKEQLLLYQCTRSSNEPLVILYEVLGVSLNPC